MRRPNRRLRVRRRRIVLGAVAVVFLCVVGLADLASNAVPVTYAGQTQVRVSFPTTLSTDSTHAKVVTSQDERYFQFQGFGATLRSNGAVVPNESIRFSVAGVEVCTGTTDVHGHARCTPDGGQKKDTSLFGAHPAVPTRYTATFAGDGALTASTAVGGLDQKGSDQSANSGSSDGSPDGGHH